MFPSDGMFDDGSDERTVSKFHFVDLAGTYKLCFSVLIMSRQSVDDRI